MNKIKFSNDYQKLPREISGEYVCLIAVQDVELEDLHEIKRFIEYDTAYYDMNEEGEFDSYTLPKRGKYLLLVFFYPCVYAKCHIFTTLRRSTPAKREYYLKSLYQDFKVVVEDG